MDVFLATTLLLLIVPWIGEAHQAQVEKSPLAGKRESCNLEGEPVAVDYIDKHKCFSCICMNGFVECKINNCPPTEGCHMLVQKEKDDCCQRCKGCHYHGLQHSSHTEWTDPKNPCRILRCEAGIITDSDLKCYTPCDHPLPPEPGKCCPTCPTCQINGQNATDDRDVISDDPCVKCRCIKGRMTCAKKACPVLQCRQDHQEHLPLECCPRCTGTRWLYPVENACMLQNTLLLNGEGLQIDNKCTNCTCKGDTATCHRAACPILDCPFDLQKQVPGRCCKECTASVVYEMKQQCTFNEMTYKDGESWRLNACSSCKCERGKLKCAQTKCNVTLPCAPGTKLVQHPKECCKKCIDLDGVCMAFGDPHFKTFDGKIYTYQGIGRYQLVADCKNHSFSIRIATEYSNKRAKKGSTSIRRVAIHFGEQRLNLNRFGVVKINHKRVDLPWINATLNVTKMTDDQVEAILANGVKIFWSGRSFLEVTVPPSYKNKLCGLCGNFNGNVQDELRTRKGLVVTDKDLHLFGQSWFLGKTVTNASDRFPSCSTNHQLQRIEKNRCGHLGNEALFGECDSKVNYSKYYMTCKMDMCNCPNGNRCHCDSFLAYARECRRMGVQLPDWSKKSHCDGNGRKKKKPSSKRPHNSSSGSKSNRLSFSEDDIRLLTRNLTQRKISRNRNNNPIPIH